MLRFDGVDDFLEHSGALCTSYPYYAYILVAAPLDTNTEMSCIAQGSTTADAFHSGGFQTFGETKYATDRTATNGSFRADDNTTPHISATTPRWLICHYASASDRRVAFGNSTFVSETTSLTSSISSLNRALVGVTRRSSGLLHYAKADLGEAWWATGDPSTSEIDELVAGTRLPENMTGRVDGWYLNALEGGGTYTSHAGTRTMTASGGVTSSSVSHPISRGDSTAPTLSSASGTGGTLVCSGSVSTNEGNGTLYTVFTASASAPTAVQVEAGQDHAGSSALRAVSQSVTGTGTQSVASGSITDGTRYAHFMHKDAAGNRSTVASSSSFVVSASGGTNTAAQTYHALLGLSR